MTSDKQELTAERLREVLAYDPATGVFTQKVRTSIRVKVGAVAGSLHRRGYIHITIDGRRHFAHRLAWLYVTGEWPPDQIDHRNGIRDDNRVDNLRLANKALNMQNMREACADNKTGFLGVSPRRGKFRSTITVNGKQKHIGTFPTPEEAHAAYLKAKRQLHPFGTL